MEPADLPFNADAIREMILYGGTNFVVTETGAYKHSPVTCPVCNKADPTKFPDGMVRATLVKEAYCTCHRQN